MYRLIFPILTSIIGVGLAVGSYYLIISYQDQIDDEHFTSIVDILRHEISATATSHDDTVYGIST